MRCSLASRGGLGVALLVEVGEVVVEVGEVQPC